MKCAIGQDSHSFSQDPDRNLILAGVHIKDHAGLVANSDGDVIYHALTNAISGITSVNVLGMTADSMCRSGITDSSFYVKEALKSLVHEIVHVSFTVECMSPVLFPYIDIMKENIASLLKIDKKNVGLTATSGEGLTSFGRGQGIMCFCLITVS
ncbi:MAG: 2-C-methyl-D-erythritol 2,4-cyclodiphosphate synthase [Clostridia bacterium]|jgi:2-C-methyl-D-erythritol 2,4-cyclodiphosphate synthase